MSSSSSFSTVTWELLLATTLVDDISFLVYFFNFFFYFVEALGVGCQGRIQGYCFCDCSGLQPVQRDHGTLESQSQGWDGTLPEKEEEFTAGDCVIF